MDRILTIEEYADQRDKEFKIYSNIGNKVVFITDQAKTIDRSVKEYLNKVVDREASIKQLNSILKDISSAVLIEASIYEFSLIYTGVNNLEPTLIGAVYSDKLDDLVHNICKYDKLKSDILSSHTDPHRIAFLQHHELIPENWEQIIKKNELIEYKKENTAATDLYTCYKCGKNKTTIYQLQTRGADEPITNFVTCLTCGNKFKK